MYKSKKLENSILALLFFSMLFLFMACEAANMAPSVPEVTILGSGRLMKLNAVSHDPEGDAVNLEWEIEKDGVWTSLELKDGQFRFEDDGLRQLRVRAVDSNGNNSDYRNFTYDSTNHAPQKPVADARYFPMKGIFKATCEDVDGDSVTLEWQYKHTDITLDSEWHEMILDSDGEFIFSNAENVLIRVRGVDSLGLEGEWTELQGVAFSESCLNVVYPSIYRYLPDGKVQVHLFVSSTGGSSAYENIYYWRPVGDTGEGTVFVPGESLDYHIGPDGQPVIDDAFEERGIVLEPGDHWIEVMYTNEVGGATPWSAVHVYIKPEMQYGYLRPVTFAFERPLFKQAVEVRFEHDLTSADLAAIRERYGNSEGTPKEELNLIDNLGMSRRGDGRPVWAYMDDRKILHVVTTGNGIICPPLSRSLIDNGDRFSYPDDWPRQTEYMFCRMENLVTADLRGLDLKSNTSLNYMFTDCKKLEKVIWPDMAYNNISSIAYTFADCPALKELPFDFGFSNLKNVSGLFKDCNFEYLDLSGIDMSNVIDISFLLSGCTKLRDLKLPYDLGKVNAFSFAFSLCESLVEPDFSSIHVRPDFDSTIYMFYGCKNLKTINCDRNFEAIGGRGVFQGCSSLESLDLSNADIENVENPGVPNDGSWFLANMFDGCSSLTEYDNTTGKGLRLHESFKMESPYKDDMFKGCDKLSDEFKSMYGTGDNYGRPGFVPEVEEYTSDLEGHLNGISFDPSIWKGNSVIIE